MQTIEIYTPNRDEDGNFVGLNHEVIFYDPEALVERFASFGISSS